jgi:crotonobetainyl-CoA:carnitine CoA-transferase CaiB-like acyl-CoA transferase
MQALDGITVLDLARGYPPAHSTMLLGDFGARVIKVDPPGGNIMEKTIGIDPKDERFAAMNRLNRNKDSIIINMQSEEGLSVFYRLVKKADVLVEGFRPGVMDRLRAGYDTLKGINPRLIYCAASGYGSDGPYAKIPGHDPCFLGITGALSMSGPKGGTPCPPSNYLADMAGAAMHGLTGILIALIARERTGKGQFVDISYADGTLSLMDYDTSAFLYSGVIPHRGETFLTGMMAWGNIYKCKDGEYFVVACGEPHFWENLCQAIGREDLISHHSTPPSGQGEVIEELGKVFLTKTRDEWWQLLKDKNTCVAPVYDISEAMDDPQMLYRQMVMEVKHPTLGTVKQIGFPVKLSDTPAQIRYLGKLAGSDTQQIMEELGYSPEDIQKLGQEGAIA